MRHVNGLNTLGRQSKFSFDDRRNRLKCQERGSGRSGIREIIQKKLYTHTETNILNMAAGGLEQIQNEVANKTANKKHIFCIQSNGKINF